MSNIEQETQKTQAKPTVELYPNEVRALRAVKAGYDTDPGTSDLYNESLILVSMTLGDYRAICSIVRRLERA